MRLTNSQCCLLVAIVLTILPVPTTPLNLPTIDDFLNYWAPQPDKKPPPEPKAATPGPDTVRHRSKRQFIGDSSTHPYEVESTQLPTKREGVRNVIDERYMPVLGTGVISTTVFSQHIFVNGFYNGKGANSHRAAVPALIMGRVVLNDPEIERQTVRKYKFNAYNATFTEIIDTPYATIEQRIYIHQKYIRLLVVDIIARKKRYGYGMTFQIAYPMNETEDITFEQRRRYDGDWKVQGRIKEGEQTGMQDKMFLFYHEVIRSVSIRSQEYVHETMMMSCDSVESAAKNDYNQARNILSRRDGGNALFREHVIAWQKAWAQGRITVEGHLQLAKTTIFAQYYLLTSLPPLSAYQAPKYNDIYYGIARNSLAKGGKDKNYRGHIFWDNEMYIMPALVLFHPEMAKYLFLIRTKNSQPAEIYARQTGGKGYRFPWETAKSGYDVTPDTCPDCKNNALHITAAVGWAIRQYYSATRDTDFLNNPDYNGCIMTREIARFWADKAVYNTSRGRYYIQNVTGPDDWHPDVDNNAYTNVMASLAIHWARYMACLCNLNEREEVPDEWIQKALYLHLPFDNVKRLHYQYDGFEQKTKNRTNKQADTIMLTYPINWNMSRDIMRNDLEFYEVITSDQTPAMTWSFFTVGWKWAKEEAKMRSHFLKSYNDYVQQPFKIWTEYNVESVDEESENTVNYLPGMAGYLQSLIYGFAGIRIRPEFIEFHEPAPPPDCDSMKFESFNYLGADMDIDILYDRVILHINSIGDYPLVLRRNETYAGEEKLLPGKSVTIDKPELGFYILTSDGTACDHPRDHIYMPWGYSPWISQASTIFSSNTFLCLLISLLFHWVLSQSLHNLR